MLVSLVHLHQTTTLRDPVMAMTADDVLKFVKDKEVKFGPLASPIPAARNST
jgi:hypothetical protein